jgi:hypothetical protein
MKQVTIFTNGKSLFTLENYQPSAGVCHAHGITVHSRVSILKKRAMHTKGQLHYVSGFGDRKVLNGATLKRGQELGNFKVN